jgi:hypothetical protein
MKLFSRNFLLKFHIKNRNIDNSRLHNFLNSVPGTCTKNWMHVVSVVSVAEANTFRRLDLDGNLLGYNTVNRFFFNVRTLSREALALSN